MGTQNTQQKPPGWKSLKNLIVVPVIGLGLMGGTWVITYIMIHPQTKSSGETPAILFEQIAFSTVDGLTLRGWHIPGTRGATVIGVHGFARDRTELLPDARWLAERGYGVVLFDTRAQGASDGAHISFGLLEALDVRAAIEFVLEQSPGERIGVIGYSMGATAAIQAAAEDPRIDAVIAVSPFSSLSDLVSAHLKPIRPLTPLIAWWGERMTGLEIGDLQPESVVAALSPRPILILQAGGDQIVPRDSGERLYQAAQEPKELWTVPGIAHVDFRQAVPDEYRRRIIGFFEQYVPLDE